MVSPGKNKAARDARRLANAEREQRAIQLRRDGLSLSQIAKELGLYDQSQAKKILDRALDAARLATAEEAEALVFLEMERLDFDWRQTQFALDKIRARMNLARQDERVIVDLARILAARRAIQERRAAYRGLDAPVKTKLDDEQVNTLTNYLATAFGSVKPPSARAPSALERDPSDPPGDV